MDMVEVLTATASTVTHGVAVYPVACVIGFVAGSLALLHLYCRLTLGVCDCTTDMTGKTVIVTGANTGIGKCTAMELAKKNARVILACRNKERGQKALDEIVKETGNHNVVLSTLDLCSLSSVRAFAEEILNTEDKLHILINNAGFYGEQQYEVTEDGLEKTMQSNHLGHFLLTVLLLDLLKKSAPSRIINVSSVTHKLARLNLDDLNDTNRRCSNMTKYGNSKVANVLFTRELSKRLAGTGVTANCLHPGVVETEFIRQETDLFLRIIWKLGSSICAKSSMEGTQTTIHLALSPDLENVSGKYFMDCKIKKESRWSRSDERAAKLWQVSERLVGLTKEHNK